MNSTSGTVYLESIDISTISKNGEKLFKLLDSMMEKIGEENVVHVAINSALSYAWAHEKLMKTRKKLFWGP